MADLFFYNPGAFKAYQNCRCKNSQMVDDTSFGECVVNGDKATVTITNRPMVCSICKKPYRVMVDLKQVSMITNLAD